MQVQKTEAASAQKDVPSWLADLAKNLRAQPKQIRDAEVEIYDLAKAERAAQQALKRRELELTKAITEELDPTSGKVRYSNESLRAAELSSRKLGDSAYILLEAEAQAASDKLALKRFDHTQLCNEFSAGRHLADLYSGWMRREANGGD